MLSALLMLLACTSGSEHETPAPARPIHLTAAVGAASIATRATGTAADMQHTRFVAGSQIAVFVEAPAMDYGSVPACYTVADNQSDLTTMPQQLFPGQGTIALYALYPYAAFATATRSGGAVPFGVQTDQTALADYRASDLMTVGRPTVGRDEDPVALSFSHRLAKLTLRLAQGTLNGEQVASSALAGSTLQLKQVCHTGTVDLSSAALSYTTNTADLSDITVAGTTDLVYDTSYSIVLPPQTLPAGTVVTFTTGDGVDYSGRTAAPITLTAGTHFTLDITVLPKLPLVVALGTIMPWTDYDEGRPVVGDLRE